MKRRYVKGEPPSTAMRLGMRYAAMSPPARGATLLAAAIALGALLGLASVPPSAEQTASANAAQQKAKAVKAGAWQQELRNDPLLQFYDYRGKQRNERWLEDRIETLTGEGR